MVASAAVYEVGEPNQQQCYKIAVSLGQKQFITGNIRSLVKQAVSVS